ncbi:hypothetical protein GCM10009799_21760 [Nocardiopsis rhodophaea]|uniref:Uncharacterized protein n=1 Tax=Nocardiopsis rhodophaea TaxID=280238 RepID=A0ABN2SZJ5_9ACTN
MLDLYDGVTRETEEAVAALPGRDVAAELPGAPSFPPNISGAARRILLRLIREDSPARGARRHPARVPGRCLHHRRLGRGVHAVGNTVEGPRRRCGAALPRGSRGNASAASCGRHQ